MPESGGLTSRARSLRLHAVVAACALSGLLVALFLIQSRALDAVVDAERDARRAEAAIATANALERRVIDLETGLRGFALTGDSMFLEPFDEARSAFPREIVLLRQMVSGGAALEALGDDIRSYVIDYAPLVWRQATADSDAAVMTLARDGKRRVDLIRERFAEFTAAVQDEASDRRAEAETRADRARLVGWIAIAVGLASLGLLTAYFLRNVIAPIQRIRAFAGRVAAGERDVKLGVEADGEIGDLADAVGTMASSLAEQERVTRGHADNLAAVADAAQKLPTTEARQAITETACKLSGGTVAVLLEPRDGERLISTAHAGAPIPPIDIPLDPDLSEAAGVFLSGERLFVSDASAHRGLARPYIEATRARSVLWEPIRANDRATAVLVVAWDEPIAGVDAQASEVIRLLAAEAAVAVERSDLLAELRHAADHDELTGLVNRRRFHEELRRHVALSERHAREVAVLIVDLDGFKAVNDREGHAAGDALLQRVADVLSKRTRSTDVVARLGGDEFAVLLPETGAAEAARLGQTVAGAIRDDASVGASAGAAASVPDARLTPEELVARADAKMYEAKSRR